MEKESRGSFIFYRSFFEACEELGGVYDKTQNQSLFEISEQEKLELELFRTIVRFGLGEITTLDGLHPTIKVIMRTVIPQIEANNRRRENGKKGGRPKTERKANDNLGLENNNQEQNQNTFRLDNLQPNDNVNVNANDNVNVNDNFNVKDNVDGLGDFPFDEEERELFRNGYVRVVR